MNRRIQLTLFVPKPAALMLDAVRVTLDPVQADLIAAHVTLCREDEIEGLSAAALEDRMASPEARPVTLHFGAPERFGEHGVLLPCLAGEPEFQALRCLILGSNTVRRQAPHITLAHPRNPRSPGNDLRNAATLASGIRVTFTHLSRILQEGSGRWQVLQAFPLGSGGSSGAA